MGFEPSTKSKSSEFLLVLNSKGCGESKISYCGLLYIYIYNYIYISLSTHTHKCIYIYIHTWALTINTWSYYGYVVQNFDNFSEVIYIYIYYMYAGIMICEL